MEKDSKSTAGEGLWNYALRIYGRDPVREICLRLQDHHEADVNLLLFLCWRAGKGAPDPAKSEILAMIDRLRPVRDLAILPLRSVRITLRMPLDPDSRAVREIARQRVLEAEIAAEGVAQALLEEGFPVPDQPAADAKPDARTALARYLAVIGVPEEEARQAAAELAATVMDG